MEIFKLSRRSNRVTVSYEREKESGEVTIFFNTPYQAKLAKRNAMGCKCSLEAEMLLESFQACYKNCKDSDFESTEVTR